MIKETVAVKYYPEEEISLSQILIDLHDQFFCIPEKSRAEATVRIYKQETYTSFIISYLREFTAEEREQYDQILEREASFRDKIRFGM